MKKLLEVIATSLDDALEAERGGADRLELLRDLDLEGLTPPLELVREVLGAVSIPVRVMLRETADYELHGAEEAASLRDSASCFAQLPIDGLVLGFVRGGRVDVDALHAILTGLPLCAVTFHRAVEAVADPVEGLRQLRSFPQIDRLLTSCNGDSWDQRQLRLEALQRLACPSIRVLVGGGLDETSLAALATSPLLNEFHVGTAARDSTGAVDHSRVAALREILDRAAVR